MAYAGLPPALFTNNLTNVQLIDDISGSFNVTDIDKVFWPDKPE